MNRTLRVVPRTAWQPGAVVAVLFVFVLGLSPCLWAEQSGEAPTPPATREAPSPGDSLSTSDQPAPDPAVPKDDRIFWTLPNFLTVENASSMPPLGALQKFNLAAKDTFDPIAMVFCGVVAGINQASNTNPSVGQGLKGYAQRYGLAFSDNAIGNMMTSAAFPALLHQDPRFYQMGRGGFLHRAWYAGTRVFVTRADSGKKQFNFSEILGNAAAAVISNAYHPAPRTLGSNLNVWGTQVGWDAVSYELKEFWPDMRRYFARHHATP